MLLISYPQTITLTTIPETTPANHYTILPSKNQNKYNKQVFYAI